MGLEDVLRSRCRDSFDALSRLEQELDQRRRDRAAALERARRAREEVDRLRSSSAEREATVRRIRSQISDLEDQLQQLQARIEARQSELRECEAAYSEIARSVSEQRKLDRTDTDLAEALITEISNAEKALERERARLRDARRAALGDYLEALWERMRELAASQESNRSALEAHRNLEVQRHQDAEVATLWEAREEWRRIVQTSGPSLVVKTARAELDRIEAELEARFPGALRASQVRQGSSEIEELFVAPRPRGRGSWIPLPIPLAIWRSIERGDRGAEEALGMRLIWALSRALPPSKHRGVFFAGDFCCGLSTEANENDLTQIESVALSMPGGMSVAFILSSLPPEVANVVAEDLDE